jgi:hypothetical protein
MSQKSLKFELTGQQAKAWEYLTSEDDCEVVYGGARGGGKSHMMCIWVFYWTNYLIEFFDLKQSKTPLPVGFFGRKQGSDFKKTTLETFKKLIPPSCYTIRDQDQEIIIKGAAKVYYGGLDSQEAVSKFTSAELAFRAIDQAEETTTSDVADLGGAMRLKVGDKRPPYKTLYTANPRECWLKTEFIPPWGPPPRPTGREPFKVFVPALPTDNPHLPDGYIERLIDTYKHDKALLKAMLEGDWNVNSGFSKVFNLTEISACFDAKQLAYEEQKVLAFDTARFGDDKTVIMYSNNRNLIEREVYGKRDHEFTYGRAREWDDRTGNKALLVFDLGGQVGASVYDSLSKVMPNRVLGINFGGASLKEFYKNKRVEMYLEAQEDIKNRKVNIPREWVDLHKELTQVEFSYRNEVFYLESKDLLKKRMGNKSPDNADTFVMVLEGHRHFDELMGKNENEIKIYGWADEELNQPKWVKRNQEEQYLNGGSSAGLYT